MSVPEKTEGWKVKINCGTVQLLMNAVKLLMSLSLSHYCLSHWAPLHCTVVITPFCMQGKTSRKQQCWPRPHFLRGWALNFVGTRHAYTRTKKLSSLNKTKVGWEKQSSHALFSITYICQGYTLLKVIVGIGLGPPAKRAPKSNKYKIMFRY